MIQNSHTNVIGKTLDWWQAVLLAAGLFFAGVLMLGIFSFFMNLRVVALVVEVGVYMFPAALIILLLKLDSAGIGRIKRLADIRLLLIIPITGLAWAAAVLPLVEIAHSIYPIPQSVIDRLIALMMPHSTLEFIWIVFLVAIIPAIAEEMLFRGIVQPAMIARFGVNAGIVLTGTIFAIIHVSPWSFGPLLILGTFFGIVSYKIGTFWAGALAHFGNNLLALSTLFYFGESDYESLTESTPWYIFVPGLIVALVGTIIIIRLKLPEADEKIAEQIEAGDERDDSIDTISDDNV